MRISDWSSDVCSSDLSGNGYLNVNAGTTLEFEGQVTGGGTLRKRGDGVLLQSGTNNYTGGSVIEAGILRAGSTSAFGTGAMTFSNVAGVLLDLDGFRTEERRVGKEWVSKCIYRW